MRLASTRTTFLRNHGTVKDPSGCLCSLCTTGFIYYILEVATAPAVAHAIKSCVIPLDLEICHTHSPCVHVI